MTGAHGSGPAAGRSIERAWAGSLRLAGLLGLLVQAALATALLHFWLHSGLSFYLLNIGNASSALYGVELAAWPVGFILLLLGRVRAAVLVVAGAAVLSLTVLALDLAAGDLVSWRTALGVSLVGLVPAACLLLSRESLTPPRRPVAWLAGFAVAAVAMNLTSDGTAVGREVLRLVGAGPFTLAFADHTLTVTSLLDLLWLAGLLVGLAACWRHPRVAGAVALLLIPPLVWQYPYRLEGRALVRFSIEVAAVGLLLALSALGTMRSAPGYG